MALFLWIISTFFLTIAFGFLSFFFLKKAEKQRTLKSFDMSLFLVMMPKYEQNKKGGASQDEKTAISQMEQIYASFLSLEKPDSLKGSSRIAFEVASQIGGTDISFYVAVPKSLEESFEKYVQGIYPGAVIKKVPEDYTIFEPAGANAGAYLKLTNSDFFPIDTYKTLEKDPLAVITNALSKIAPDEGAAVQIIIRPLGDKSWKSSGSKILSEVREGKSVKAAIAQASRPFILDLLMGAADILINKEGKEEKQEAEKKERKAPIVDERTVRALEEKVQKQAFEANIRLLASAQTQVRANEILGHLESAFGQFSLSGLNGFKPIRLKKRPFGRLIYDFSFRSFNIQQKNILNIEEMASIFHFSTSYLEAPHIKSVKGREAPPPVGIAEKGVISIGEVSFRGEKKDIAFASREDRRRHFYVIGQTGTGKTSLLREMIRQDIQNGEGVAVIDPHGDLIEATLANVPKERAEDVVLFEPFDLERPIGLNMLQYDMPEQKDFAVQEMIEIFHKLFPPEIIGPMFEHYMRNALLALMADKDNPGTLVEVPRMFTDDEFMEEKLEKVKDPLVRSFWLKEWKQITGSTKSDMLGYVVSKVGRFIENEMIRNIIGQPYSGFDLAKIMDEGKIFLVNLSKGLTGEVNSALLGLILVSKMQMAAMARARISEEKRKDFYLYIDEFQSFTTNSIATILSEARKYKLNLILAHQYIPQLVPEIKNAIFGNVGTIGAYRIGADDAEFLEKQFEPEFSRFDLVNLDNYTLIVKMMINGKTSSPFILEPLKPKQGNQAIVEPIKKISRLKYGRSKEIVEEEISQKLKFK